MTNGQMLDELRKLAAEEKTVPTKVYLRMFSAAMADIIDKQNTLDKRVETLEESMSTRDDNMKGCIKSVQDDVAELRKQYNDSNGLSKNPMIVAGRFIRNYPKLFSFLMVLLVILSNVWFISGFRRAVLLLLHVPSEIVNMLAP